MKIRLSDLQQMIAYATKEQVYLVELKVVHELGQPPLSFSFKDVEERECTIFLSQDNQTWKPPQLQKVMPLATRLPVEVNTGGSDE